jgi:hypothetical protein
MLSILITRPAAEGVKEKIGHAETRSDGSIRPRMHCGDPHPGPPPFWTCRGLFPTVRGP